MNTNIDNWSELQVLDSATMTAALHAQLQPFVEANAQTFVQDLSHISEAAIYEGGIQIDAIEHLSDALFRCVYSYDWAIAWTCSGTQEAGRVQEKVRFMIDSDGTAHFKFLKLD